MEELRTKTEYQPANDPLGFPQAIAQKIVNRFLEGNLGQQRQPPVEAAAIKNVNQRV
jgi:hypothetical protein